MRGRRNKAGEDGGEEGAREQQGEAVRKETQRGTWVQEVRQGNDGLLVQGVSEGPEGVQGVAEGYEGVQGVREGQERVLGVSEGYKEVLGVAEGYEEVQGFIEGYKEEGVQEMTDGHYVVQGVVEGCNGAGELGAVEECDGRDVQGVVEGCDGRDVQEVVEGCDGVGDQGVVEGCEGRDVQGVVEGCNGVGDQGVVEGCDGRDVQGVVEGCDGRDVREVIDVCDGVGEQGVVEGYDGRDAQDEKHVPYTAYVQGVGGLQGYEAEVEVQGLQGEKEVLELKGQMGTRHKTPNSPASNGDFSEVGVNGVWGRQDMVDRPLALQELGAVPDSHQYAQLFTANSSAEMEELEDSIEEMLVRLDEFCAMMDMIRNETSHILEEKIPALKIKVEEMNLIYSRVDKLEAFVKMVGHHVTFMEEEVTRAESDHLSFPQALNRLIQGAPIPPFLRKKASQPPKSYELPKLYRTEDYFPASRVYAKNSKSYQLLPSGL